MSTLHIDQPHENNDQKPVVLVMDDSPTIHRLLAVKLRDEGVELLGAYSGEEGIELAQDQGPALILCDLNMPGIDGFEVVKRLKSDAATMQTPIIMLSGSDEPEHKVRCFDLGAMDFVSKPFDVAELRARIQSAIRITNLMKLLEQRAQIDGLTGLWNRAHFDQSLASEIEESARRGQPLSLAITDIDHFKKLNDNFGHQAGDYALESFAKILTKDLRTYDIACRYGGEEFALILPGTGQEEAVQVCERIRRALESTVWPKYPDMRATASFGVTTCGLHAENTPEAWIKASDESLYAAKEGGRNRVHIHDVNTGKSVMALKAA